MVGSNLVGGVLAKLAELKRTTIGPTRSSRANGRSRRASHQAAEMLEERIVMTVQGALDPVNSNTGIVQGWAQDTERPNRTFDVKLTIDGSPSYSYLLFGQTGLARPDVNRVTGIAGNHGFEFQIPDEFRDGRTHRIEAAVQIGIVGPGIPVYETLPPSVSGTFQLASRGGITVTPIGPANSVGLLETTEDGRTASFNVVLTSRPTANVTIPVVSLDLTEGRPNKTSLTFTPSNWNQPQRVTVTGVDDRIHDASVASGTQYQVALGVARSSDPRYSGLNPRDVALTNRDNEEYIRFVASYANEGRQEGFNDPILGQERRESFETALRSWSGYFAASYAGETITVDAQFDPLAGSRLAQARAVDAFNSVSGGIAGTSYGSALANHLARRDLNSRNPEISATFNSNANWHYGVAGQISAGQFDFVTLAMHEIGHGLNFFSRLNQDGSFDGSTRGIWDRFLENSRGTNLINMTAAQRATAVVSDSMFWEGAAGRDGNDGQRPQIHAPREYASGSSTSHLSESRHGSELMSPTFSGREVNRSPSRMELGMLADMGWTIGSGLAESNSRDQPATARFVAGTSGAALAATATPSLRTASVSATETTVIAAAVPRSSLLGSNVNTSEDGRDSTIDQSQRPNGRIASQPISSLHVLDSVFATLSHSGLESL